MISLEPDSKVRGPREPPDGEPKAVERDEGGDGVREVRVVLGQTSVSAEPCVSGLYHTTRAALFRFNGLLTV